MENLKEIKELRRNANNIYELFNQKIPKWETDKKHYDKTGYGFNEDSRFNSCKAAAIAFSSHMGTYGDSGCSRQCDLDENIFQRHLVKYLNRNKKEIMLSIAKQIEQEALTLKSKAENELNSQLEMLNQLEASVNGC
jgi:hypothetical protein